MLINNTKKDVIIVQKSRIKTSIHYENRTVTFYWSKYF